MRHLQLLVELLVAAPDESVSGHQLLSAGERNQVVNEWNETEREYEGVCAHQLFEAEARRRPEATAVSFGAEQVSYGELNRRANQLAHHLRGLGVGLEVVVGISLPRSIELLVGVLGVLKAGGAYLPLDAGYPAERLAYMMEDAGISVLVTEEWLAENLPASWAQVVCLEREREAIAGAAESNPESGTSLGNLAYVIYTSGSTGKPKGVQVEHGGLSNLAQAQAEAFGVTRESRVLQFASFNFDASVSELFATWAGGGTLCLGRAEEMLPGAELIGVLKRERITMVTLPPSVLRVLPWEELPELETLISAGEACSVAVARRWGAGRRLINAYGPTEATVCGTIKGRVAEGEERVTIGRAMANVEVYLLDAEQEPVAVGIVGEIYLGGVGVARGYQGRSEQTSERFVPHPYSERGGSRMYRTGDLGRYRGDGESRVCRADR